MNSLRRRLLAGLLLVIALFWAAWFGFQAVQMSREQTGHWDASVQAIGQQILLSMPAGSHEVSARPWYSLPPQVQQRDDRMKHMAYQVWSRDGRALLRSTSAPTQPFVPLQFDRDDAFAQVHVEGEAWRVYTISDAKRELQVQMAKSQRQLDAELGVWLRLSLFTALLLMALLGAVAWWIVRWSLAPADAVGNAIAQRAPLDLQPLADTGLPQELRPLVDAFNQLLARLDTALQAERRFLADAAHELRTPLAALMTQAQLAHSAATFEENRAALLPLIDGIERNARLTEQILDLARLDAADNQARAPAQPLHELVAMVVHDFDAAARQKQQRLRLHTEPCSAAVVVDAIGVLVRNLVDNALRYSGAGARIEVVCRPEQSDGARRAVLRVRDDGPGVPAAERARIFDRFYRVPGSASSGSGVGLSLVARIAQLHGATVEVGEGLDGRGLGITVRFTPHERQPDTPASAAAHPSAVVLELGARSAH